MHTLFEMSAERVKLALASPFRRYLIDGVDWTDRLISIAGARGAGKTTMMLQNLHERFGNSEKALYLSLDDIYFTRNTLVDTADIFVKRGGEILYLDEVHKYPNWSIEIKNLYDRYPTLKVVVSGSSMLELYKGNGDLSRRLSAYNLEPMSFREYLELEHGFMFPAFTLSDILERHREICNEICEKIRPLAYFADFLRLGALPFYKDSKAKYFERMRNVVNLTLDYDLPSITPTDYAHVIKIKLLLKLISEMVPYKPNIAKLASQTEMQRKTVLKYLDVLHRSGLITQLAEYSASDSIFTKPKKILLGNTSLMYALCEEKPQIGTVRETFFVQQLMTKHKVYYSSVADFLIDNKYTFEIGGKSKTKKQIWDIDNTFTAVDDIEYGLDNRIPLWLFGFLY